MNDSTAVSFHNVGKRFRKRGGTLRSAVENLRRTGSNGTDSFWALDDVNFQIGRGEAVGIIGANGAGKSTALKLLAGITRPTKGNVEVRGRVASLIEVGAGFHPDLTGRENVYLNGSIIGMSRSEINQKFDDIVAFAELQDFIDMPVKRYSSGMYMRLGFAVAAHVEPDILLVDEVLAVGDRSFQAKSLKRMQDVAGSGTTVVFISHNMNAVQGLCPRGIYLDHGRVILEGPIDETINRYLDDVDRSEGAAIKDESAILDLEIARVVCRDEAGRESDEFLTGQPLMIDLEYRSRQRLQSPNFNIGISDGRAGPLAQASMLVDRRAPDYIEGEGVMRCRFETLSLLPRTYQIWCEVLTGFGAGSIVPWAMRKTFRVVDVDTRYVDVGPGGSVWHLRGDAPVYLPYRWERMDVVQSPMERDNNAGLA